MFKLKSTIPILLLGVSINAFAKPPVWELVLNNGQKQLYADIGNIVSLGNHKVRFVSKYVKLSKGILGFSMHELNCKTGKADSVNLLSVITDLPEIKTISFFQRKDLGSLFYEICVKKGEK